MPRKEHRSPPFNFATSAQIGYASIFVILGLALAVEPQGFKDMWRVPQHPYAALTITQITLFLVLAIFTIRWIVATQVEMDLWLEWTDIDDGPRGSLWPIMAVAIYLGLSLAFVHSVLLITLFTTAGYLVNYVGQIVCNRTFRDAVANTTTCEVPPSMIHYWLHRPQLARILILTFIAGTASAFAIASVRKPEPHKTTYALVAYWILLADILAGEVTIEIWRRKRDREIEEHARAIATTHQG